MKASEIEIGMRFGRLVTIEKFIDTINKKKYWLCQCDCGNTKQIVADYLARGITKSCGCIHKEQLTKRNTKHGKSNTKLYIHWSAMKQRCYNPNTDFYYCYGEKGITVCDEWLTDFTAFEKWSIDNGYTDNLTLDRIDWNKGYSPNNCRWISSKDQVNNTGRNHYIMYKNERLTVSQASEKYGIPYDTLKQRLNTLHWSVEQSIETPVRETKHMFWYNGNSYSGEQISVLFGFSKPYAGYLLKQGKSEKEVVDYLISHTKEISKNGI